MTHPLAQLPITAGWIPQRSLRDRQMVVCQLSRGVAPVMPVAEALYAAHQHGAQYWQIAGYSLVEAKNRAVGVALSTGADLVIVEDDVLADQDVWARILAEGETVRLASANCRDGSPNTRYTASGDVLYSGNVLLTVPLEVLVRLPERVFEAIEYTVVGDELARQGENRRGTGSDTHFWYTLRRLEPAVTIEVVGKVTHLLHPLSAGRQSHAEPCMVEVS